MPITLNNKKTYYSRELVNILGISLAKLQWLARILKVKKDSTHIYNFTEAEIQKIKKFLSK